MEFFYSESCCGHSVGSLNRPIDPQTFNIDGRLSINLNFALGAQPIFSSDFHLSLDSTDPNWFRQTIGIDQ